jgi:hypothetical protein
MHRIAGSLVRVESLPRCRFADQLDLVDDDARSDLVRLGDHQEAIDHARMRIRLGRREHDDDLIDVRREDTLTASSTGRPPRKLGSSRKNLGDRPGVIARDALEVDVVADRQLERLRGGTHRVPTQ